jgi:hypothetical protein
MATYTYANIDLKESKRLADLHGIIADLKFCHDCCGQFVRSYLSDALITQCLATSIVVRYARCFNSGKRNEGKSGLLEQIPSEDRDTHEIIYALRDKHYGHAVSHLETYKTRVWLNPTERGEKINSIGIEGHFLAAPDPHLFMKLVKIIEHLIPWLEAEIEKEKSRLLPIVSARYSLSDLYSRNVECAPEMNYEKLVVKKPTPKSS